MAGCRSRTTARPQLASLLLAVVLPGPWLWPNPPDRLLAYGQQQRPPLPETFVPLELSQFPTLEGSCNPSYRLLRVVPPGASAAPVPPSSSSASSRAAAAGKRGSRKPKKPPAAGSDAGAGAATADGATTTFPSIAEALAAVKPGGTRIEVAAGTYRETPAEYYALLVDKDDVCIQGAGPGRSRLVAAAPAQVMGVHISGSRVTLAGLSIEGFSDSLVLGRRDGGTQRSVVVRDVAIACKGGSQWNTGIHAFPDHRNLPGRPPVLDGLLLSGVSVTKATMGISCDNGPCAHWWLDNVTVETERGDATEGFEDFGWGADTFAVEDGRQIVLTRTSVSGSYSDGFDLKADDVVLWRCTARNTLHNALKLWRGGDVREVLVDGTSSESDAALAGSKGARYRYVDLTVRGANPAGRAYVGHWGYGGTDVFDIEFSRCTFQGNSDGGGFFIPVVQGTKLKFTDNVFGDVGTRLMESQGSQIVIEVSEQGLADLEARGWGSGNRIVVGGRGATGGGGAGSGSSGSGGGSGGGGGAGGASAGSGGSGSGHNADDKNQ